MVSIEPHPRTITLRHPRTLMFGDGCAAELGEAFGEAMPQRVTIITSPPTESLVEAARRSLERRGAAVTVWSGIDREPTVAMYEAARQTVRPAPAEAVVGLGGGSVLDVAKLVAALLHSDQPVTETFGIDKLAGRSVPMACLPTTAGTGSEVSPNAILLDETDNLKKGVVSPHLVADIALVDPALTHSVPQAITAATGIDALTHCIEAHANRFAHPIIDLYALKGIELIATNLKRAVDAGTDADARAALALGSMYGGICLGPVNTGAVHALAYPLGGTFHVAHGVSNAVLLPHVIEFNLEAMPQRYAAIARAMGVDAGGDDVTVARRGARRIAALCVECGIPSSLAELDVPRDAVDAMAAAAVTVQRLLKNNPREVSQDDARRIYERAFG